LNMSLFERLVNPTDAPWGVKLPFDTLETQRRMHPSISALIRETLYPNLEDAPNVHAYPEVVGLKKRLFWLDHDNLEAGAEHDELVSTSKSNDFEVEMAASLIAHLLAQGEYQSEDIAILTPYLGQLFKLRARLSQQYEIVLDDQDAEALEKHELVIGEQGVKNTKTAPKKGTLLQALKAATGTYPIKSCLTLTNKL